MQRVKRELDEAEGIGCGRKTTTGVLSTVR